MAKFKVGDKIQGINNKYEVIRVDAIDYQLKNDRDGSIQPYTIATIDSYCSLIATNPPATHTPKFKVGDVIVASVFNDEYTIDKVDTIKGMYTYSKPGVAINSPFASVEISYTLKTTAPNPLPPFSQAIANSTVAPIVGTTGPNSPHLKPKVDLYIGKQYKITQQLMSTEGEFRKFEPGDIIECKTQSRTYHGEYEFVDAINKSCKAIIGILIPGYTFKTCLQEYTAPKCSCGLTKTYMETHRREPPKHAHYNWCDISKEG